MEAELIKERIPYLLTAISDIVQPVSDQCLAKGLIPESVYKRVLESGETSDYKARTLILAVKASTEADSRCLEMLLSILETELPEAIKDKIVADMRKAIGEKYSKCRALVASSQTVQLGKGHGSSNSSHAVTSILPSNAEHALLSNKDFLQLVHVDGLKLEESIRKHAEACVEKKLLEEQLKLKSEESNRLKEGFRVLTRKTRRGIASSPATNKRISNCEAEMMKLKKRIKQLELTIEEHDMRAKRERNFIEKKMKQFLGGIQVDRKWLVNEFEVKLKEKDEKVQDLQKKYDKAMDDLRMKDLEHKVALQVKDLRTKDVELELERTRHDKSWRKSPSFSPPSVLDDDHEEYNSDDEYRSYDENYDINY